ncbi:MAG: hypothetical protein GY701_11570 [Sulfitobacter sp.]|nr:hypothetical protein [Sulfitobacter sp.]
MTDPVGQSTEPSEPESPVLREVREEKRKLEVQNAELRGQVDEGASAKKELMFLKANVPDDSVGGLYRKSYDGEMTVEAIQTGWDALGIAQPGEVAADPPQATPGAVESPTAAPVMFESFTTGTESSVGPPGLEEKIEAAARSGNQAELEQLLGAHGRLAEQ